MRLKHNLKSWRELLSRVIISVGQSLRHLILYSTDLWADCPLHPWCRHKHMHTNPNKYSQLAPCWLIDRWVNTRDGVELLWKHIHLSSPVKRYGRGSSAASDGPHLLPCSRYLAGLHLQCTQTLLCISKRAYTRQLGFPLPLCVFMIIYAYVDRPRETTLRLINR